MNEFSEKAKSAAADAKAKVEELTDKLPDSMKDQAHDLLGRAEELFHKVKDKVEDLLPGDKNANGH